MAKRRNAPRKKVRLGDVNPIQYGGGFVYGGWRDERGQSNEPFMEFTHGMEGADGGVLTVYRVDIAADVLKDHDWVKPEDVCRSLGADVEEWRALARSRNVLDRAAVLQDIGGHWGWENLDHDPLRLKPSELRKRWSLR